MSQFRGGTGAGFATRSRNWTLRGAVLILALQLLQTPNALQHTEEGLELLFRERSQSDWENVWHRETHSRCRDKLVRQLYWACEKDIYRLTRRNRKRGGNEIGVNEIGFNKIGGKEIGEVLGNETGGKAIGVNEVLGNEVLGNEIGGSEVLGNEVLGNEVLGNEVLGNEIGGNEVLGNEVGVNDVVINPYLRSNLFMPADYVPLMLRTRRLGAPSITNECCTRTGCTWEEYAEYCPSNKRRNHY